MCDYMNIKYLTLRDLRQVDHLEPDLSASAQCIVLHLKCQLFLDKVSCLLGKGIV